MSDRILVSLLLMLLCSFVSFLLPNVLFPKIAIEKGLSLNVIGFVFCMFSIGLCITSEYLGKNMAHLGRKRLLLFGGRILSLTFVLFAFSRFISNYFLFLLISLIARTL